MGHFQTLRVRIGPLDPLGWGRPDQRTGRRLQRARLLSAGRREAVAFDDRNEDGLGGMQRPQNVLGEALHL